MKCAIMKGCDMTPVDVGAGRLIPKCDATSATPATYGWMKKEYDKTNRSFSSGSSLHPGFKVGFTGPGFENSGEWGTIKWGF